MNDIIFDSTNEKLCKDFELCMKKEFEMSMMGELNYFLKLQIRQMSNGIFVNQAKYTKKLIKKFGLKKVKIRKILMTVTTKLDKNEQSKSVDIKLYHSMTGNLLYLMENRLDIMLVFMFVLDFNLVQKNLIQ